MIGLGKFVEFVDFQFHKM